MKKQKIKLYRLLKYTIQRKHAWFSTNVGIIRKNLVDIPKKELKLLEEDYVQRGGK